MKRTFSAFDEMHKKPSYRWKTHCSWKFIAHKLLFDVPAVICVLKTQLWMFSSHKLAIYINKWYMFTILMTHVNKFFFFLYIWGQKKNNSKSMAHLHTLLFWRIHLWINFSCDKKKWNKREKAKRRDSTALATAICSKYSSFFLCCHWSHVLINNGENFHTNIKINDSAPVNSHRTDLQKWELKSKFCPHSNFHPIVCL